MPKYQIANLVFEMNPKYERLKTQAIPYLIETEKEPNFTLNLPDEKLKELQNKYPHLDLEELEYIFLGQLFYKEILKFNGMLLHASAVVKDGEAYLFSAPSGTGKSTHTQLWLKEFPDAYILNDDKPAIFFINDMPYVAGTPFSGKHDISRNELVPLKGICFITRSEENWIEEIDNRIAVFELLNQTERVPYEEYMSLLIRLVENVIRRTHIFKMGCNISKEAVYTAYNLMENPLGL